VRHHVRYWHLADNAAAPAFVRYWTKADLTTSLPTPRSTAAHPLTGLFVFDHLDHHALAPRAFKVRLSWSGLSGSMETSHICASQLSQQGRLIIRGCGMI
jgi:hypothetical protein